MRLKVGCLWHDSYTPTNNGINVCWLTDEDSVDSGNGSLLSQLTNSTYFSLSEASDEGFDPFEDVFGLTFHIVCQVTLNSGITCSFCLLWSNKLQFL